VAEGSDPAPQRLTPPSELPTRAGALAGLPSKERVKLYSVLSFTMKITPSQIKAIQNLRAARLGYNKIAAETKINEGTVRYWCNPEKWKATNAKSKLAYKLSHPLMTKLSTYRLRKSAFGKVRGFKRRGGSKVLNGSTLNGFTLADVLQKIGPNPTCYLTGRPIDLNAPKTYTFDHITPATRGGDNSLKNLGLLCTSVNKMKSDLTVEELLAVCAEILRYNGYTVTKMEEGNGVSPLSE
jgi:hypothetical protein